MIFRQLIHEDLGCASYLVGDEHAGVAAVVDPKLDVADYLRLARSLGVSITDIVETHNHADHISGHGRLVAATGARIHIHELAEAEYDHLPFADGFELELGAVLLRAVHTPGHRPEHTSMLVCDRGRSDEPWAVLTGDALFVGDTGRPDLAIDAEDGARQLFRSLHAGLHGLPDHVEVWPGHLGGSLCGGSGMDRKTSSTIGYERRWNAAFAETDEDRFVVRALAAIAAKPPRLERIVAANRGPLSAAAPCAGPLTPGQVQLGLDGDVLVVDVRTAEEFDDAHIPGAVSIPSLRSGFATKLSWILADGQAVALVGRDDDDARAAGSLAAAVGIDGLVGHLAGGMTSWYEEGRSVRNIEQVGVAELRLRRAADTALEIVDVRDQAEWSAGHIRGSRHAPYHALTSAPDWLAPGAHVAAICASGGRAGVAASLLERHGAAEVLHVVGGGVGAWAALGEVLVSAQA
ncbi:MAG TPA: MBL fold metallo-hydrolase [Solirubrobacteraceae bacterium]|nr:MBL fold metallo-hydrolase [Solirubrobacteraceae bacterium]